MADFETRQMFVGARRPDIEIMINKLYPWNPPATRSVWVDFSPYGENAGRNFNAEELAEFIDHLAAALVSLRESAEKESK